MRLPPAVVAPLFIWERLGITNQTRLALIRTALYSLDPRNDMLLQSKIENSRIS